MEGNSKKILLFITPLSSYIVNVWTCPQSASTKSHASEKIKTKSPYSGILRIASDVFFDADSESPHMTQGKNATLTSYSRKTAFSRSRDQCAANWCTNFNCSLGLGFWDGLGLWLSSGHLRLLLIHSPARSRDFTFLPLTPKP